MYSTSLTLLAVINYYGQKLNKITTKKSIDTKQSDHCSAERLINDENPLDQ